ncbi:iron-sulfur cluster assembly accessory protein [Ferrovum sp.]|jgi:Iron-sulfur cluster assembly accessory protein|uniref:HesB/IscA family protein n=1 Tax=Ferrovum sp. TaxID=2609467 RepID=UPI00262F960F|nr:iron-sulfur cluster assembly accessory protein [Ferrovum sp.]
MNITVTPGAEKFIRQMVRFNGGNACGFRLSVSAGGCSGLSAEFTVEPEPRAGDSIVMAGPIKLFLPAESRLLLDGVTIDYLDTPTKSGFSFVDPKASPCACGSSMPAGVASVNVSSIKRNG